MDKSMNIHFLGASGTVTGSKFLIELPKKNILIDCGMFQGVKEMRELNWQQLPVNASDIDLVLITHGHLDHTGFLPRLVNMGFTGDIWGTAPTLDIAEIILRDSAKIQEEDAERANKEGFTKHKPAKPLYNSADVDNTVSRFKDVTEGEWIQVDKQVSVRFRYSGHILGATFIELDIEGKWLVFSGDIGRPDDPLLSDPGKPDRADILFLETTYGDRLHSSENMMDRFETIIADTVQKNGTLIVPSFAVERAQLLMHMIWQLHLQHRLPPHLPVYLDSPMGANVFNLFQVHHEWHKLSPDECRQMCKRVRNVQSFKETWEIIDNTQPKIVIAGSGMVTGGRVLTYLKQYIGKPETTVLLAGYQAEGTRGSQLQAGASEVKIYGKYYPVRARVESLNGLSAHADQSELLDWLSEIKTAPDKVFLIHGEPQASDSMRVKIRDVKNWSSYSPNMFEIVQI